MKIGITGIRGNLGSYLVGIGGLPLDINDISDPHQVEEAIQTVNPDVIINCAAASVVDAAETKDGEARAIRSNMRGVAALRDFYHKHLIHLSSSYVFDGQRGPYNEKAKPNPIQAYGFSKWGGEVALQTMFPDKPTTIVRTVGLYGGHKPDFVTMVRDELEHGNELEINKAVSFNPTYIPHLAEALMRLAEMDVAPNLINIAGDEVLSRYEFALMIASIFGLDKSLLIPRNTIDQWIAKRPKNAGLNLNLAKKLGLPIYKTLDGLRDML